MTPKRKDPNLGLFMLAFFGACFVELWVGAALSHYTSFKLMYFYVWWGLPYYITVMLGCLIAAFIFAGFIARRFS